MGGRGRIADLGFYKGGCPIHLKGAPEVESRRRRGGLGLGASRENVCIPYIKMMSFYAFPVIFIDTVTFNKGTLIKMAGVRTPPGSAPVGGLLKVLLCFFLAICCFFSVAGNANKIGR